MANKMLCPACQSDQWNQTLDLYGCLSCGTEVVPHRREFKYTESYQQDRGHYDGAIQTAKVETFIRFLKDSQLSLGKKEVILEIGFGGGAVLEHLAKQHDRVFGLEAHGSAVERLAERNFSKQRLATDIARFSNLFDVLFYLDSFEHLLAPQEHLEDLDRVVRKGTRALVVLPRADSISRYCMGSLWPHNVPDHWVFYSRKGLVLLWERHGWRCVNTWSPHKKVSLDMILRHAGFIRFAQWLQPIAQNISVWVRLGEMGVVFEKL